MNITIVLTFSMFATQAPAVPESPQAKPVEKPTPQYRKIEPQQGPKPLLPHQKKMLKQGYRFGRDLKHEGIERWEDGLFWPQELGEEPGFFGPGGF